VAAPPLSPDDAQASVLSHGTGALLVLGDAGTGKTAVLRERFARQVGDGARAERVALVLGSRGARDAARAALLERLRVSLPGLQVLTIHGLAYRVLKLREGEPPEVLSAAEQFAKVRELLAAQDPAEWPAYGHLLGIRGFADEVRQLLTRMQESLWTPERLAEAGAKAGLGGWAELARFAAEYQDALDMVNQVDYAGLVQRAAAVSPAGAPPFDEVLVDDYQDTTLAAEALLQGLGAQTVVVAANAAAHVFSFQGRTRLPLDRFAETFPGAATTRLATPHRAPSPASVRAWVAPHSSEEHAAIARELRRLHVEDGTPWRDLAVVVRRQGAHLGNLLRALDDARIPRAVPERGRSLTLEAATYPYVLALRWLVAEPARREELIEPLLTSDVVGLSPAAARGLIRLARTTGPSPRAAANALDLEEGLAPEEASALAVARDTLAKASLFAGMSVQDAFKVLWEELPCSARLVEAGGAELDVVVTFANVVSEASEQGDASVEAFLEALDAGEHGPGWAAREAGGADAVQVLTAHGAAGLEFDTVIVAGVTEGDFPSLGRPEPMFDLGALAHVPSRSEQVRERLEDERRLFRMVLGRARRAVVLVAADARPEADELSARSRFVDELDDVRWTPAPGTAHDEPVSVREAAAIWRRQLADPTTDGWRRLAALEGLRALGVDPTRWWFTQGWTDTGRPLHETLRLSYSRLSTLDNCELQHVLGDELGLGRVAGYHAWVGKLVHGLIEDIERGKLGKTKAEILAEVAARWRDQEFPSKAVAHAFRTLVETKMLPNWWYRYGEDESLANELRFEFEYDGATMVGVIDRIGAIASGGTRITDFKTGNPDNAGKAEESLQLGIYYLAVEECEDLAAFRPVRAVELAFVKGNWRTGDLEIKAWQVTHQKAEPYQAAVKRALSTLIARKKTLVATEIYRPNPSADCHWCEFKPLCPLWPEGQPVFEVEAAR
jgi:superfamily I DNA/RNA helicase/RecB family exonuclease